MEPGDLCYRVILQRRDSSRDRLGGETVTWKDVGVTWAAAVPLSGRELIAAQQKHAEITTRFRIRYRAEMSPAWRVIWEGRSYDVLDVVDVDGQHWELDLLCSSGLRNG